MDIVWIYFPHLCSQNGTQNRCFNYGLSYPGLLILDGQLHIYLYLFFFSLLRSNSQQEIYWAANLLSSNWLRKNLNEFLNIQPKSIVTLFILGPRQIEIETINGNTSFWKNESWQLHSKHRIHTLTATCECAHARAHARSFAVLYSGRIHDWIYVLHMKTSYCLRSMILVI